MTVSAGGVYFEATFRRGDIQKLLNEARQVRQQLKGVFDDVGGIDLGKPFRDIPKSTRPANEAVKKLTQELKNIKGAVAETRNQFRSYDTTVEQARKNLNTYRDKLLQVINSGKANTNQLRTASGALKDVQLGYEQVARRLLEVKQGASGLDDAAAKTDRFDKEVDELTTSVRALAAAQRAGSGGTDFVDRLQTGIASLDRFSQRSDITSKNLLKVNTALATGRTALDRYFNEVVEGGRAIDPLDRKIEELSSSVRILRNDFITGTRSTDEIEREMRELANAMEAVRNGGQLTTRQMQALSTAQATAARTVDGIQGRMSRLGIAYQTNLALQQSITNSLFRLGPAGRVAAGGFNIVSTQVASLSTAAVGAAATIAGIGVAAAGLIRRGIPEMQQLDDAINVLRASGEVNLETIRGRLDGIAESGGRALRQFSDANLTSAVSELVKAGLDAGQALEVIASGAQLAAAEQQDLNDTSALLLQNLRQFSLDASDAAEAGDAIAQASLLAAGSAADLQRGLAVVGPAAAAANFNLEQTLGVLVNLDNRGLRASEKGATGLRNVLIALADPTKKARETIEALGIALENADGSVRPVQDVLFDLNAALIESGSSFNEATGEIENTSDAVRIAGQVFDTRGVTAILAIDETTKQYTASIEDANGKLREWSDLMSEGSRQARERLGAAIDNLALSFTEAFGPAIIGSLEALTALVDKLSEFFGLFESEERKFAGRIESLNQLRDTIGNATDTGTLRSAISGVTDVLEGPARQAWIDYIRTVEVSAETLDITIAAIEGRLGSIQQEALEARQTGLQVQQQALQVRAGLQEQFDDTFFPGLTGDATGVFPLDTKQVLELQSGVTAAQNSLNELEEAARSGTGAFANASEAGIAQALQVVDAERAALDSFQDVLNVVDRGPTALSEFEDATSDVNSELAQTTSELFNINGQLVELAGKAEGRGGLPAPAVFPSIGLGDDDDDEDKLKTVQELFTQIEQNGIAAQRRALAFAGTTQEVEARLESARSRAGLFSALLNELLSPERVGLGEVFEATDAQIAFITARMVTLNGEADRLTELLKEADEIGNTALEDVLATEARRATFEGLAAEFERLRDLTLDDAPFERITEARNALQTAFDAGGLDDLQFQNLSKQLFFTERDFRSLQEQVETVDDVNQANNASLRSFLFGLGQNARGAADSIVGELSKVLDIGRRMREAWEDGETDLSSFRDELEEFGEGVDLTGALEAFGRGEGVTAIFRAFQEGATVAGVAANALTQEIVGLTGRQQELDRFLAERELRARRRAPFGPFFAQEEITDEDVREIQRNIRELNREVQSVVSEGLSDRERRIAGEIELARIRAQNQGVGNRGFGENPFFANEFVSPEDAKDIERLIEDRNRALQAIIDLADERLEGYLEIRRLRALSRGVGNRGFGENPFLANEFVSPDDADKVGQLIEERNKKLEEEIEAADVALARYLEGRRRAAVRRGIGNEGFGENPFLARETITDEDVKIIKDRQRAVENIFDSLFEQFVGSVSEADRAILGIDDNLARFRGSLLQLNAGELAELREAAIQLRDTSQDQFLNNVLDGFIEDVGVAIGKVVELGRKNEQLQAQSQRFASRESRNIATLQFLQQGEGRTFETLEEAIAAAVEAGVSGEGFFDFLENRFEEAAKKAKEELSEGIENVGDVIGLLTDAAKVFSNVADAVRAGDLSGARDSFITGAAGLVGGILEFTEELPGLGGLIGAGANLFVDVLGIFERLADPFGEFAREFAKSVEGSIGSGLSSALSDFVLGDLSTEELEEQLFLAAKESLGSGIISALIDTALIQGALQPLLQQLGRAIASGRTDLIPGIVADIKAQLTALVPGLVSAAKEVKDALDAAFPGVGLGEEDGDGGPKNVFQLPQATELGLDDAGNIVASAQTFASASVRLADKFDRLVDEGIRIEINNGDNGGNGLSQETIRA